jgi:hypothetical protein
MLPNSQCHRWPARRTPFQEWLDAVLARNGSSLRDAAWRLRLSPSTVFRYRAGTMLPRAAAQRTLAILGGAPAERVAELVERSRVVSLLESFPPLAVVGVARWRRRHRRAIPLGVAFTMSRTGAVREDRIRRLYTLAARRRTSLEALLDEAVAIALPLMEGSKAAGQLSPRVP